MYNDTKLGAGQGMTLVAMHFLGGCAREWDGVRALLGPGYGWVAVDLPGFGEAAGVAGYSVEEMVEHLAGVLDGAGAGRRLVLLGHSMSGKVAMVAARRAAEGDRRFAGVEGLVLAASSPAGPEPMTDGKRAEMLPGLDGSEEARRAFAEGYLRQNVGRELAPVVFERAVEDVLRTNPAAWRAWLDRGSREDWSQRVRELELPVLVIGGTADADLGAEAQRRLVLPHLRAGQMEEIPGAGHLLPMEAAEEMAELIRGFVEELERRRDGVAAIPTEYLRLIASERVSAVTRGVLLERAVADDPGYVPAALSGEELKTLRAVAERVVPGCAIDLAARLDKRLANEPGKGWRYAELPRDVEAYKGGLAGLDREAKVQFGAEFTAGNGSGQDAVLRAIWVGASGREEDGVGFTGAQMQRWFEDVRADLTGIYVAHPATLAAMGYSGIADGARSEALTGFVQLGMGAVAEWEPEMAAAEEVGR